jgi:membrane-associated protease RseP (regulator of RpoE activity)
MSPVYWRLNMHRTTAILIALLVACGFILSPPAFGEEKKQTNNFVARQRIGAGLQLADGKVSIRTVAPNLPAEKAGLLPGDVVLMVDGKPFASASKLFDYIGSRKEDAKIAFEVQRDGQMLTLDIKTVSVKMRPTLAKLYSLLLENQKVALAIVISDVKNTFDMKKEVAESWAAGIRNGEQTSLENFYLKNSGGHPGFSIVDRTRTQAMLDEFKMGQTGLVSEKVRLKIGEMTGATHLLDATFSRFRKGKGHEDVHNIRLIDIQSGTVLAVDQMRIFTEKKK